MAGSSWPTLTAGAVARASDVNAHFAWLEGHIVPQTAGSTTDLVYDLGTTTARWNKGYIDKVFCTSIGPTTTALCITVGTTTACTTTADSDVSVEFAGIKAIALPRLSTTQIGNLTSVDGMLAYNTSTAQLQIRKAGVWVNVGGPVYKAQAISITQLAVTSTQTILNITSGGGRIHGIQWRSGGASRGIGALTLVLDGNTIIATTTVASGIGTTTANEGWLNAAGMCILQSTPAWHTTTANQVMFNPGTTSADNIYTPTPGTFDFASTAALFMSSSTLTTNTVIVAYSLIQ